MNSVFTWLENHPKSVFLTRAFAWAVFAAGLPFAFIAWRYGLFMGTNTIQLSGWGMIGVLILAIFTLTLLNYLKKGLKTGFFKQCATGFVKVILPLLIVLLIVEAIKQNIILFEQALSCVIMCELIAIPINPFPAWIEKKNSEQQEEKYEGMADVLWDKFFKRQENKDK